jgi:hypothetical protein
MPVVGAMIPPFWTVIVLDSPAELRHRADGGLSPGEPRLGHAPRLAELVDGVVFESFSARWTDEGYAPWPPDVLEFHAQIAEELLQLEWTCTRWTMRTRRG